MSGRSHHDRRLTMVVGSVLITLSVAACGGGSSVGGAASLSGSKQPTAGNTELSIEFQGPGGVTIGGNLLLPPGAGSTTPGVVIVPDDGATNRDGLNPPVGVADPFYSDLAKALASAGIASLRYDRRGEGQSVLPPDKVIAGADVVGDAKAGADFLTGRADIDSSRLALIGHGEGGLVALQTAALDPAIKAAVLISTPGRPLAASMADQVMSAAGPVDGPALVTQLQAIVAGIEAGGAEPAAASIPATLQSLFPPPNEGDYLRSVLTLNAPSVAASLGRPRLVVNGGADPALSAADSSALLAGAGAKSQALSPPSDNATLESLVVAPPTTDTTTAMDAIHAGGGQDLVRDNTTMSAIVAWLKTNAA